MLDPIADMLTRVRNAQAAGRASVVLSFSSVKEIIAQILVREGYASRVERSDEDGKPSLRYGFVRTGFPTEKKPLSLNSGKGGCRLHDISENGYGIAIVSTSKGIMTERGTEGSGWGNIFVGLVKNSFPAVSESR
jgi:small subunit ribosomal protein S8